jgi:CDP-6-deoxy-D-xylo-4-hexulose-3-dehydrase
MIKLIKSTFYKEEETKNELMQFIKKANILSFSSECQKFEKKFAKYQGRKYSVFLNSGSSANLAIIQTLINLGYLRKGDSVGFSSVTWSTNVMPLIELGLLPVPVDVELNTLNVSSKTFTDVLKKTSLKALFLTNLLGFCDDIDKIRHICKRNNIVLIEDNCESLGTVYRRKKLGNYGIASTFSFYVGHHMSTIEGGAVCTDNEKIYTMLNLVRAHGWDRNLSLSRQNKIRKTFKINSEFYSRYTFYDLGYNLRPTEIAGFLGNYQLAFLDEITHKRNKNFLKIVSIIYNSKKYLPVKYNHISFVSNFAIPIICKDKKVKDEIVKKCAGRVEIRPIVGGNMIQQPFFKYSVHPFTRLFESKNAKFIHEHGLYFGNNPDLTDSEINELISIFK